MPKKVPIPDTEIIQQIKLSCQLPTTLKDIHVQQIITDTAQAKEIVLNEDELQQAADSFRLQNNLIRAEITFSWLEKYALSTADFECLIRRKALRTKLAHFLFAEEVEACFYRCKLDYTKAVIYEIILPQFDLALELFYGIQEREFSFWDIAHRYIEDIELRRRGGYRGLLSRNALKPEISAVVFAARPPQILKPIVVDKQAHLIYVEEVIQPELNEAIRHQIIDLLFTEWLDKQLNDFMGTVAEG